MKQVQSDTQVMIVIEIDKMSERLKKAYSLLVAIQKGLARLVRINSANNFEYLDLQLSFCSTVFG